MLEAVVEGVKLESGMPEKPAFYVFDYCRGWISRIPVLVRDDKNPDDVDTQQKTTTGMEHVIAYCIHHKKSPACWCDRADGGHRDRKRNETTARQ
jgi:hypothetical protein